MNHIKIFNNKILKENGGVSSFVRSLIRINDHYSSFIIYDGYKLKFLLKLIKLNKITIHIMHLDPIFIFVVLLKKLLKLKIIYTQHGNFFYEQKFNKNITFFFRIKALIVERMLVKFSDVIISPSQLLLNQTYKIYRNRNEKIVIPHSYKEILENYKKISFSKIERIAYYSGNSAINNQELFKKIAEYFRETEFYVFGDIEVKGENIINFGVLSETELFKFLSKCQMVVNTSLFQSFSIFLLDSIKLGLIPIFNKKTGLTELMPLNCSIIVNNIDFLSYIEKMESLLDNKVEIERLKTCIDNIVFPNINKVNDSYNIVYNDLNENINSN